MDPVYGKGKLSEIQGLILGMLDTFNYEQSLRPQVGQPIIGSTHQDRDLETTTSLLNHDLHWSLAHLRASVTRGLVPRQDTCNICLLQYRRRHDPPEEIVIFSACRQDCGSGSGSERPQQWSCFKCSSNQGGRGGAMADQRRARSTSLAQTNVTSSLREPGLEAHGKKLFVEATLDPQQAQSWDHLRCLYHGPSRLAILSELTHCHGNEKAGPSASCPPGHRKCVPQRGLQAEAVPPPAVEE
ncbi:unnamed protein product [Gadus morhua 'NCC']